MLAQAWVQKEKRPEYESAAWQPEPELAQPPPRSVSFSASAKLGRGLVVLVAGIMVCFVCLPFLKHAYLTSYGVPIRATVQQRYSRESGRSHSYYLVVRYETPSGWQSVRIRTSRNYYLGSLRSKSVPAHYLARIPSQVVLDGDQLYPPWLVLPVLAWGAWALWFPYYLYRKARIVAENAAAVKGLIIKINGRLRNRYLTMYYEFQGVAYQGAIVVRANQAGAGWQPGKAITLLVASEPPSGPRRPHVFTLYPTSEFKINP
jgi:hypothetical protein